MMEHTLAGRLVFVGIETTAFSGATLLSFLLNSHPHISSIGEMNGLVLKNPDEYLCSCGTPIRRCEFWHAMCREMAQRGFEFDVANFATKFQWEGPRWMQRLRTDSSGNRMLDAVRDIALKSLPGECRRFKRLVARNTAFIESVVKLAGKDIFVDTSKDRLRARALKMFSPYDVRVIHLVRDPRGVVASRLRRGRKITPGAGAHEWVWLHTRLENYRHCLAPSSYLRVRYEDLCRDPRSMLRTLYRFCGADPAFEPADFMSTVHHIVGNPMRLSHLSTIELDERWREQLSLEQQRKIWQVAGRLGMQYGYAWESTCAYPPEERVQEQEDYAGASSPKTF